MIPGAGRGRGAKVARIEDESSPGSSQGLAPAAPSSSDSERLVRGRGGIRQNFFEMNTIPRTCTSVKAQPEKTSRPVEVLSNFIKIAPMKERTIYQFRVEFNPNIESAPLRRTALALAFKSVFETGYTYDGGSDLRSSTKIPDRQMETTIKHPSEEGSEIKVTVREVGVVNWSSFEMLRLYSMHAKDILRALGFYQINNLGAYINPQFMTRVGDGNVAICRGFKTAANVHMDNNILINLESVHKLLQTKNLLEIMVDIRRRGGDFKATCRSSLQSKLVVTSYVKRVYKIEDINFDMSPKSTFRDEKKGKDVSYLSYYEERYGVTVKETNQPLVLVVPNQKKRTRPGEQEAEQRDIYLIPELCNIAGLTNEQREDNRMKIDLIRASQVHPKDKVAQMQDYLSCLHSNKIVVEKLKRWGYEYEKTPVKINARVLAVEKVGLGDKAATPDRWACVDQMASFDNILLRESLAKPPQFEKLAILVPKPCAQQEGEILGKLKAAFTKINLIPQNVEVVRMDRGDAPNCYVQYLKNLSENTTAAVVIMPTQNASKYDAVKKLASCERGLITQVVTGKLLTDPRKASGAAVKIGIQLAAKIGGEPWYVNIPLKDTMVCGYDTYHDGLAKTRSYGAFVASMNDHYSRWWSKADSHDRPEEMSSHLTENLILALRNYRELNNSVPGRVFIYRDGVGDGDLSHVYNTEMMDVQRALREANFNTKLTVIVVNKRVGARFFMKSHSNEYQNCPPGTVIDDVVTRRERYDYYLISQSTRNGTVSPTYYNVIVDESGLKAQHHQAMAYKFCFLYYNWSGSVRVPAPCQYAHKLAYLCGEHLHSVPNSALDDRLHFL